MPAETVLVVDDAREFRELLADLVLRPNGYAVLLAESAAEALETAARQTPDLIISDVKMPGMDGLELARAVQGKWPGLPVILITAEGSEAIAQQALRAGAADYFIKPFESDELLRAVARALARRALELRQRRAEALLQSGLAPAAGLAPLLESAAAAAAGLAGAAGAQVWLPEGADLRLAAVFPDDGPLSAGQRVPAAGSLAGQVLSTGAPLRAEAPAAELAPGLSVTDFLGVPLRGPAGMLGVLSVTQTDGRPGLEERALPQLERLAACAAAWLQGAGRWVDAQAERSRLLAVLDEVSDGVLVLDPGGRLELINPAARALLRIEAPLAGLPVAEAVPNAELTALLASRRRSGTLTLPDHRALSVEVTPLGEAGRAVVIRDITVLAQLDRVKSEFVATISHDLRSPLTSILGYISLLERVGPLTERQQEFVGQARASVQAMTDLLTELLDLGQIESGVDAPRVPLDPGDMVARAADEFRRQALERGQELTTQAAPGLPRVRVNPVRMRQLMANLLDNALKYTPDHGRIRIETHADDGFVLIAVHDTGIGIPAADLPYVFDKFFRGSNVRGRYPGTGLGLAIAKSIVDQHGGRIWIKSPRGEGTAVSVLLPAAEAD